MISFLKSRTIQLCFTLLVVISGYFAHFLYWDRSIRLDWDYFNSLSLVVRSLVLKWHVLPLRDPWIGGGLDILSNPQSRVFSPGFLFDVLFDPHTGNLLYLMVLGVFGFAGMYRLARVFEAGRLTAWVCGLLFINSGWFGNHYAEGHVAFGTMQLLPWVLVFCRQLGESGAIGRLAFLMAFFLLDGGIYTFVYGILLCFVSVVSGLSPGLSSAWKNPKPRKEFIQEVFIAAVGFFLFSAPKWVPLLFWYGDRVPQKEVTMMPLGAVLTSFFQPLQSPVFQLSPGLPWRMHEFGCYAGSVIAFLIYGRSAGTLSRTSKRFLWIALGFFWIASGWGGVVNPWSILWQVPLINNAHVQSRLFLLVFIFLILGALESIDSLLKRRLRFVFLLVSMLIIESLVVKAFPAISVFSEMGRPRSPVVVIPGEGIKNTVETGSKPEVYFAGDSAVIRSYEPAMKTSRVLPVSNPVYRGEAWIESGKGKLDLIENSPSRIRFSYDTESAALAVFNTNFLMGWSSSDEMVVTETDRSGLLQVKLPKGSGTVDLVYSPWYLSFVVFSYVAGLALFGFLLFRRKKTTSVPDEVVYDYSQIPIGYYDEVYQSGPSIQRAWHVQKFDRVRDCLPRIAGQSILDVGCFSGSFLSSLGPEQFSKQIGVDILEAQVAYANQKYGSPNRRFFVISDMLALSKVPGVERTSMDCVTCIEVIEHLRAELIHDFFSEVSTVLKPGGILVLTTPNYLSAWPLIEILLNWFSPTSYEEQHITRFNSFNFVSRLREIYPEFDRNFSVRFQTTTHFIAPFLAGFSFDLARRMSRRVEHRLWRFPIGNLLMIVIERKATGSHSSTTLG